VEKAFRLLKASTEKQAIYCERFNFFSYICEEGLRYMAIVMLVSIYTVAFASTSLIPRERPRVWYRKATMLQLDGLMRCLSLRMRDVGCVKSGCYWSGFGTVHFLPNLLLLGFFYLLTARRELLLDPFTEIPHRIGRLCFVSH
jgi:hypothetical protein